ncbi:N-acetyl-gamma-glutamyl-phosphate reductase [Jatrophihabitans sp.]|uniref:N-acetyl-gamma-glutamyl-phosphate reductase n=1 Tax=Jatrophihabitans sp. TaxID=1932789 RepID=UPI002CF815A8|nr:N-acetyl-gamma-glutamyl-phosphate reductase [Jatrophihabitans sp.]
MLTVAVVGGAGYIGGELIRLVLGHPDLELAAVTSRRLAGRRLDGTHPNLRGTTDLSFVAPDQLGRYDVLLLATGHTETMHSMPDLLGRADVVIDLSADFRLADPAQYRRYYQVEHPHPELLDSFVPGLPELHRKRLVEADRISVPGCMATAAILALQPLADAGLVAGLVTVDARTGSSGSGATPSPANLHAERSGAMRVFAPSGHRHQAEISQSIGGRPVSMTATGVEAVRGVQVVCRVPVVEGVDERTLRLRYREFYRDERFVRVVTTRTGLYRLPEPKILTGTNYCDVGFAVDEQHQQVLAIAALDNLVKGGAGNAVQCLNIRFGLPEHAGLDFIGLHPV